MAIKIAEILEKERRQKLTSFAERARKNNENIQASRYLKGNKPQKRIFVI
jgi:hypothetical protein